MKKEEKGMFWKPLCSLGAFVIWTLLVCTVDVQPIGPGGSSVGFAAVNGFFRELTGTHWELYTLTDWLSLIPLLIITGFGICGMRQWIVRKSLRKVDPEILLLGGFYLSVMAVYVFFEHFAVNYRPVLIQDALEPSYPSSTTVLVLCVMRTFMMQMKSRNLPMKKGMAVAVSVFTVLMVTGRLLSGVHWVTDIIGGILLSMGLVQLYGAACRKYL